MRAPRPKYIFFDVANTLLHKPELFGRLHGVLKKSGMDLPLDLIKQRHKILSEFIRFPNKTSRSFYDNFNRELLLALGVIPEAKLIDEIYAACSYLEWQAFSDVGFLKDIKLPVGIISNWDTSLVQKIQQYIPFHFDRIITSSAVGSQKPDKAIFDEAAQGLSCDREQIVYVGDSIQMDYLGSGQAGFTPVLIDRDSVYPGFDGLVVKNLYALNAILE